MISDILDKWQKCQPTQIQEEKQIEDVDTKLAKLLENKHIATVVQRQYTPEELRIREQILSQYSQVEFDDEYEYEDDDTKTAAAAAAAKESADPMMAKNTNALDVQLLAKERREQARQDSKAKKDKDKEDREKQKQQREDKKEKRKTVKGERKR